MCYFKSVLFAFLLGITSWLPLYAQSTDSISFEDIPLTWADFTPSNAKIDGKTAALAMHTLMTIEQWEEGWVWVRATMQQVKANSYVYKPFLDTASDVRKQALLRHEKGHFIIAVLKQIWLEDTLNTIQLKRSLGLEQQLKPVFVAIESKGSKLQQQYDKDTYHSTIADEQQIWEQRLLKMLNEAMQGRNSFPFEIERRIRLR